MPRTYTDSETIEYHEDGSWTTTTVINGRPATTAEKATAWTALTLMFLGPIAMMSAPYVLDKIQERRERKRQEKPQPEITD